VRIFTPNLLVFPLFLDAKYWANVTTGTIDNATSGDIASINQPIASMYSTVTKHEVGILKRNVLPTRIHNTFLLNELLNYTKTKKK
jgi:hypothetical protein